MNDPEDDQSTGLPWPRKWGGVYGLVIAIFAAWVSLLTLLSLLFR